jgi:hypothetical protein
MAASRKQQAAAGSIKTEVGGRKSEIRREKFSYGSGFSDLSVSKGSRDIATSTVSTN